MREVFITATGSYLPGAPVDNHALADRFGDNPFREKVLAANGIKTRHYAAPGVLNEHLAAEAITQALTARGITPSDVGMLATGTTQPDLLVPGFASMVHGRIGGGPMETLSAAGVCASSMAALKAAAAQIRLGEHDTAVVAGSELVSRSLLHSGGTADTEFLRWTLSDGAGAVVLESSPHPDRPSLRLDWVRVTSHAHDHPVCMSAGLNQATGQTWQDYPTIPEAAADGLFQLRQDMRALPALARLGLREFLASTDPAALDHILCHYSADHFRQTIFRLLGQAGTTVDESRWFSNLPSAGNTGAASIFVMLDECLRSGRFTPDQKILVVVPESGRFTYAFAHLTCVAPASRHTTQSPLGAPRPDDSDTVSWTVQQLAQVWSGLEAELARVPVVRRIESGTATLADYRDLLVNLRQQVIEGGRWIARAASQFSAEYFELRSLAIGHAAEEHRDFRLLEADYVATGGDPDVIRTAPKNIGSEALSAFMFHQAGQPDPVDLLGAMFVIEGLGTAKALHWAGLLSEQLGLGEDQTTFLRYHGANDDDHFAKLRDVLRSGLIDRATAARIVKTAKVTARLYALQLAELNNV
ncbi:3-oxoacyl-[acyl-carrier-protein] synthase III C-terminal domain-containing protein [Longispora albida]|uniref:3-oxoacyl-[acyl-carrier-protein] synthase III C-terminal domain-containing protein n=1 Tax=Longispora albida TaxID=203523 RepID=UPI00036DA0AB|nr:3-oxoacyl-[acyl-carrier-protein] synthase III C-terminal domain-containing protein [Longispora albida]